MDQTFFGLTPEQRPEIHSLIFDIVWAGEGRWSWETIYHMPIFLRKFYVKKIEKIFDDREKARKKAESVNLPTNKPTKGPF